MLEAKIIQIYTTMVLEHPLLSKEEKFSADINLKISEYVFMQEGFGSNESRQAIIDKFADDGKNELIRQKLIDDDTIADNKQAREKSYRDHMNQQTSLLIFKQAIEEALAQESHAKMAAAAQQIQANRPNTTPWNR